MIAVRSCINAKSGDQISWHRWGGRLSTKACSPAVHFAIFALLSGLKTESLDQIDQILEIAGG